MAAPPALAISPLGDESYIGSRPFVFLVRSSDRDLMYESVVATAPVMAAPNNDPAPPIDAVSI